MKKAKPPAGKRGTWPKDRPIKGPKATVQNEPKQKHDPNRCATKRCKGEPIMTHLGQPVCQKCWDNRCNEEAGETPLANHGKADEAAETVAREANAKHGPVEAKAKLEANGAATVADGAKKPKEAKPKAKKATNNAKPKRISALDAAAQVLAASKEPMGAQALVAAMTDQNLWTSPKGKTPHATLYAAMQREIAAKGTASRFKKVDRGYFAISS